MIKLGYIDVWLLLLFSCSVLSDSLRPHALQHTRLPRPLPSPGACSNSCPLSQWCYPTLSSSVVPFSFYLQPSTYFHIIMAKTLMWLWNLVNLKFFKLYKWGWELQNSCLQGLCNFVLIYMRRWLPFAVLIQPGSWFTLWVTPGAGDWGEDTWGKKWLISLHSAFLVEHLFKVFFFI